MKRGDIVRSRSLGWRARVIGISTNARIIWQDGDLADREALVPKDTLEVVHDEHGSGGAGDPVGQPECVMPHDPAVGVEA